MVDKIEKELQAIFGNKLTEIILYGSYARNDESNDSDIDIIVLVDDDRRQLKDYRDKVSDIRVNLSLEYDVVISILVKSYSHFTKYLNILPFYSTVNSEGVEIYGR